jgi:hypothetical protein
MDSEDIPEDIGIPVFTVVAHTSGILVLHIEGTAPISLFEIAGVLHDMSVDVAKYVKDRHAQAREN